MSPIRSALRRGAFHPASTGAAGARPCRLLVFVLLVLFGVFVPEAARAQEDLSVLKGYTYYADAPNAAYRHLSEQAFGSLRERAEAVGRLQSAAQWRRRQAEVRQTLMDVVGPFPERTPLNARTMGRLERDGYHVEKLVYESVPGFYVTAALFVPAGLRGKAPAVLYLSGHTAEGFRSKTYQHVILNLVRKGFVVLAIDPVGQGERLQYFDPATGEPAGGPTSQHSYVGAQAFLAGRSLARYMIWDGIRAIDYLAGRDEVDPARIGVTGRSGGGTQSAYLAAFDDRVRAVAVENYITSFRRLLETRGPQDAEQNFYHGIARGLDHADLLAVRAPRPALIIATTRDIFSIQGVRETYAEVRRAYAALGEPDHLALVEDDDGHASTPKNREALYAFFQQHLGLPGAAEDAAVDVLDGEALRVTETGQLATSLQGETVFDLNRAETQKQIARWAAARQDLPAHLRAVTQAARRLSGYRAPDGRPEAVSFGRYRRDGYVVERYALQGEGDYVIPVLLMVPDGPGPHPAVVYLHPDGKAADAAPGGAMERLVRQGHVVLAPDLLDTGELGAGAYRGDSMFEGVSYGLWYGSVLVGRSLAGLRAGDVVRGVRFLRGLDGVRGEAITVLAHGTTTPVALHAAAFEPAVTRVALVGPLVSYRSLVTSRRYDPKFIPNAVAGALTAYDLPDLAATLAPRRLLVVNPVDAGGARVGGAALRDELAVLHAAYAARSAGDDLKVTLLDDEDAAAAALADFLR